MQSEQALQNVVGDYFQLWINTTLVRQSQEYMIMQWLDIKNSVTPTQLKT